MNPYPGHAGTMTLRLPLAVASLGVLAVGSLAQAQAPSFTTIPNGITHYMSPSVSPNGRYVASVSLEGISDLLYRYDRSTGATVRLFSEVAALAPAALDDGRVIAGTDYTFAADRVFRWNPDNGEVLFVPVQNGSEFGVSRASSDGLFALGTAGFDLFDTNLVQYDFTSATPSFQVLSTEPNSPAWNQVALAAVTLPIDGVRYIHGTVILEGSTLSAGATWSLGQTVPTVVPSLSEIIDVSPRGDYLLGRINSYLFVRGDGTERQLFAPIFPVIMTNPVPRYMSDDGRVVLGGAYRPDNLPEAVVWRKGQQATTLRAVLEGAGVAVPAGRIASLTSVSADGTVVAGTYVSPSDAPESFVAVLPSTNNTCETARSITYGTIIDSTNGASRAGVSGGCHSEGSAPDVWFSFVPATNETVTIDTCGSSFDTTLTLFQASTCGALGAPLACNDDANPACSQRADNSRLSASVFGGQNYFIRVSGWNGRYGSIQLTVTAPNRPANDACAQALSMGSGSGWFFNNANAITDNRPNCSGAGTPFNDLWYRTVAPESGRMTYSTCGSTINTVLIAYPGSACGDINTPALACGQSSAPCGGSNGTRLTVPCTIGDAQLVRVGGLFGAVGSGQITARFACDTSVLNSYAASVVGAQPRAYWRFEDSGHLTAADAMRSDPFSCGNYPGEYIGDSTRPHSFQGKALTLDGFGGHARFPDATHVTDPAACPGSNFGATLEAWVRTTDPNAGVILTNRTAPGELSLTLVVGYNPLGIPNTAGRVMFVSDGPGVFFGGGSTQRIDDGDWHHVVGRRVVNGGGNIELQVYIDGVPGWYQLPGVGSAHSGANGPHWLVGDGTAWNPNDARFNGQIDEVAIYCGALAPGIIASHYKIGHPCPADFNLDAVVNSQDFFDFLAAFFGGAPSADFNEDNVINSQDFFDFINEFFTPC